MRMMIAGLVLDFVLFVSALAQDTLIDADRNSGISSRRHQSIVDPNAPLPQIINPFQLSIVFDSTGRQPRFNLVSDLPLVPRRDPAFASFRQSQTNDSTLCVAISIVDHPVPQRPFALPVFGDHKVSTLVLVFNKDTAVYAIHLDTARVEELRRAPFVQFGKKDAMKSEVSASQKLVRHRR